jgi:hypothetical protein
MITSFEPIILTSQLQAELFLQHKYAQIIELVTDKQAEKNGSIQSTSCYSL